jgi:GntR family transcriptional regulator
MADHHALRLTSLQLNRSGRLLTPRRGRGTFVRDGVIEQPLGALYSLFRSVEEQGFVQRSITRRLEERQDEEAATMLGCPPGEPLVFLERLRLADDVPIVLDSSWLPAVLARPLLEVDFTHTALYQELHIRCWIRPDAGWERIHPVLPDPEQRGLLSLPARTPALAIEPLATWQTTPVEWRHSIVHADRFSYVARWSARDQEARFEPVTPTK